VNPDECRLRLAGRAIKVEAVPPPGEGGCTVEDPVRLVSAGVAGVPNGAVLFPERPVVSCRFAETFGDWVGTLVAPLLVGKLGIPLASVRTGPGFECRPRNRVPNGKPSAHGTGTAIDISGFELADKRVLAIKQLGEAADAPGPAAGKAALAALRTAACGWFTTVLGPGSDSSHADHLHLDLQPHGSSDRYRICQ
jgi:hypothetical protein